MSVFVKGKVITSVSTSRVRDSIQREVTQLSKAEFKGETKAPVKPMIMGLESLLKILSKCSNT